MSKNFFKKYVEAFKQRSARRRSGVLGKLRQQPIKIYIDPAKGVFGRAKKRSNK